MTIGTYFHVEPEKINKALEEYTPQNNRSQLKETASNKLIIDAYNANPTSMMAALHNFCNIKAEHKMVILGDMKELGATSIEEHQKIVDFIEECNFERIIIVGDQFGKTQNELHVLPNVTVTIEELKKNKPNGFYILIKGSNSMKLGQIADFL